MPSKPRILELVGPAPKEWGRLCIVAPWVGVVFGHNLSLYHLETFEGSDKPTLKIPTVRAYALVSSDDTFHCFAAHPEHTVSHWATDESGAWVQQKTLALPEAYRDQQPLTRLDVSPSGRYLHVHLAGRTLLYRTSDFHLIYETENTGATAQFCFFSMPSGRELAYLTTKSYLEVTLLDCASGQRLYHQDPSSLFDLIHLSMHTSHDGRWLLANGLVWADKPEALVYSIQAWEEALQALPNEPMAPGTHSEATLPWHQVLRFYPPFCGEEVALPTPDAIEDGVIQVHSHIDNLTEFAEEIEDDDEYFDDLEPENLPIAWELYELRHTHQEARITRWIDLQTKEVRRFATEGTHPHEVARDEQDTMFLPASYTPPEGKRTYTHRCLDGKVWVIRVHKE